MKQEKNYQFENLTEEETSVIVSSLFRELHLIEGKKHYRHGLIRSIIQKVSMKKEDGPRLNRKLD